MKLKVANGGAELAVSDAIFGKEFNESLVHQVVTAYRNAGRSGTKAQLTKAEVRGGGRKPRPQKGGGTSRAGSIRSPIWVGGGRAFAAKPRDFAQKVNKKMYRGALQSMLSELVRQDRLVVINGFTVDAPKTKLVAEQLKKLKLERVLIIVEGIDEKLFLAARNLTHVEVLRSRTSNPLSLASYDNVLVTSGAVRLIEERLHECREHRQGGKGSRGRNRLQAPRRPPSRRGRRKSSTSRTPRRRTASQEKLMPCWSPATSPRKTSLAMQKHEHLFVPRAPRPSRSPTSRPPSNSCST